MRIGSDESSDPPLSYKAPPSKTLVSIISSIPKSPMAHSGHSDIDATVVNDAVPSSMSYKAKDKAKALDENAYRRNTRTGGSNTAPSFVHSEDYFATKRPFCVKIGEDGLIGALEELDKQLQASGRPRILSRKKPTEWLGFMGQEINPGEIGVVKWALYSSGKKHN
jgi:hypothetical protein